MSRRRCEICETPLKSKQRDFCTACRTKSEAGGVVRKGVYGAVSAAAGYATIKGIKALAKAMKKK